MRNEKLTEVLMGTSDKSHQKETKEKSVWTKQVDQPFSSPQSVNHIPGGGVSTSNKNITLLVQMTKNVGQGMMITELGL